MSGKCASHLFSKTEGGKPAKTAPTFRLDGLEWPLQSLGRPVDRVFCRAFRITGRLLSIALQLLCGALRLQLVRSDSVADTLFCFAGGLIGHAGSLVRIGTHDSS